MARDPEGTDDMERIRSSFAKQGLMSTLGATLGPVSPGEVEIEIRPHAAISQQHGFVHAGAVTAIADTAAGGQPIKPEGGYYSYDKLVIEVEWKSILGAAASVRYVWYANAWDYEHGWRLRDVKIRPWGDESDEVVVSARR